MKTSGIIKSRPLLSIMTLLLSLALSTSVMAADLSQDDAKRLLKDTKTIASYLELKGESDYAGKPQNVIKAALFGCFETKNEFNIAQDTRKEEGKQPLPETAAMFSVNGTDVPANSVLFRHENPNAFKGLSESYTCFITRQAVEIGALRYTGHRITKHVAPKGDEFLGETLLNDKGYFVSIEGLGDAPTSAELKKIEPKGDGFVLTGDVVEEFIDHDEHKKPSTFRLELTPGEAPGAWKRQYSEQVAK